MLPEGVTAAYAVEILLHCPEWFGSVLPMMLHGGQAVVLHVADRECLCFSAGSSRANELSTISNTLPGAAGCRVGRVPGWTGDEFVQVTLHRCLLGDRGAGTLPLESGPIVQFASISEEILLRKELRLCSAESVQPCEAGNRNH